MPVCRWIIRILVPSGRRGEFPMICPVCHGQMIKSKHSPSDPLPESIKCVCCRFVIYFKGLKPA